MKRFLLFAIMCVCVSIGAWASTVTQLMDWNLNRSVGTITVDGTSAIIEFTEAPANLNPYPINQVQGKLTDIKVIGPMPTSVSEKFNKSYDQYNPQGFHVCERMDFSEATANIPASVANNSYVKSIVLPGSSDFSSITTGSSVEYIVKAKSGESEANALEIMVKSGTSWANDPIIEDASYLKVYGTDGSSYLENSAEVEALQSTKWVNGECTGTIITTEDLTIDANSQDEANVLTEFLTSHKIKNLTVTGEVDDLTIFDQVPVKNDVDFSGITNNDLSTLKLPTAGGSIKLPGGSYEGGTIKLADGYTADQLNNIMAALTNSGFSYSTIEFPGGTTYNTEGKVLTVSTADENGGNLKTIADAIRDAEYDITYVKLEKYGTSWSSSSQRMTLNTAYADQENAQKTLLENAGFTVSEVKVTSHPDISVSVDADGAVVIRSSREGALQELLNANDDEANAAKAIIQADSAKGEGSKLVLQGAFKADDLNRLTQLNNATESVDMSNTTFSNADDAKFTYWGQSTLKTAYMSNDPKVTTITDQCFQNMNSLENLYIGESVTVVPSGRFASRTSLKHVTIPSSVVTIESTAFQGCTALSDIDWGNDCHVETIGASAFERTNIIGTFTVPNSVKTIGESAFKDNNNIKTLIFGEYSQIESIGASAFAQDESTDGKLSDVFVNVRPARMIECAKGAFDKFHAAAQTRVGTVTTRLHYPREYYEYYVGTYKSELYDQNLDYVEDGVTKHTYGVITQDIINRSFAAAANGWQEFMSSGIPVGEQSLYRTYSEAVAHLVPDEHRLQIYLVHDYDKGQNLATCVQMKEGDVIPANTGFIIHSNEVATIYLPFSKSVAAPYNHEDYPNNTYNRSSDNVAYNNYLKPINGNMHIDNVEIVNGQKTYRNYFFNNGTTAVSRKGPDWDDKYLVHGWGFFRAATGDYPVWNKAFLHLPADMTDASSTVLDDSGVLPQDTQGAKSFGMFIIGLDEEDDEGVVTPVERIVTNEGDDSYYTLQGVRVNTPTDKGIYINNGKKVIVK